MSWGCVLDVLGMCPGCPGAFPGGVLDVLGVTRVYELNFKRYAQVPPPPNNLRLCAYARIGALHRARSAGAISHARVRGQLGVLGVPNHAGKRGR